MEYTDSLGFLIPEQSVSIGRLSFGPEVNYFVPTSGSVRWMIGGKLDGIWSFEQAPYISSYGELFERDEMSANLGLMLGVEIFEGAAIRMKANFYGLGSGDYSSEALRIELTKSFGN